MSPQHIQKTTLNRGVWARYFFLSKPLNFPYFLGHTLPLSMVAVHRYITDEQLPEEG